MSARTTIVVRTADRVDVVRVSGGRVVDAFEESKVKRAGNGQFSASAGAKTSKPSKHSNPTPKAPAAKEFHAGSALSPSTPSLVSGSHGTAQAKALAAQGVTARHVVVQKNGGKSQTIREFVHKMHGGDVGEALSSLKAGTKSGALKVEAPSQAKPEAEQFHVKNEAGRVIAHGTAAEINAKGVHAHPNTFMTAKVAGESTLGGAWNHKGELKNQKLTLHVSKSAKPEAPQPKYKVSSFGGTHVAEGTVPELAKQGISVSALQQSKADEQGHYYLNGAFHSGAHAGKAYKIQSTKSEHAVKTKSASISHGSPETSKVEHNKVPPLGQPGDAQHPDTWERPSALKIPNSLYLERSAAHLEPTHEQKKALNVYSSGSYAEINSALRGGDSPYGHGNTVKNLSAFAEASRLKKDGVFFRGVSGEGHKKLQTLQPGDHLVDQGFTSISHSKAVAHGFSGGPHLMIVRAKAGAMAGHMGPHGQHMSEHEVVLPPGNRLKYAGRSHEGHFVFDYAHGAPGVKDRIVRQMDEIKKDETEQERLERESEERQQPDEASREKLSYGGEPMLVERRDGKLEKL